jgi:hypothetical protein
VAVATLEDGIRFSLSSIRSGDVSTIVGGHVESLSPTDIVEVGMCSF